MYPPIAYNRMLLSENKWLAARYGLDAPLMDLGAGKRISYEPDPSRHLYLVPSAKVLINGVEANARDGVAITGEEQVTIEAEADAELVLVDAR